MESEREGKESGSEMVEQREREASKKTMESVATMSDAVLREKEWMWHARREKATGCVEIIRCNCGCFNNPTKQYRHIFIKLYNSKCTIYRS